MEIRMKHRVGSRSGRWTSLTRLVILTGALTVCLLMAGSALSSRIAHALNVVEQDSVPAANTGSNHLVIQRLESTIRAFDARTGAIACEGDEFSVVLQCAISALPQDRQYQGTVSVKGAFETSKTVTLPSYTTLDLSQANIVRARAMNAVMFRNQDRPAGNTHIQIIGGTINGSSATQTVHPPYPGPGNGSQYVIYFDHVTKSEIRGTTFVNSGPDATIHADDCQELTIDSITIEDSLYETILLRRGGRNRVMNSQFTRVGTAVATAASSDVTIEGNKIQDSLRTSAISVNGNRNIVVNNTLLNPGGSGITLGHAPDKTLGDILNASGSIIANNTIVGGTGNAIHMLNGSSQQNVRITGNTLQGVRDGIAIGPGLIQYGGVQNIVVDGNSITGSQRTCVRIQGATPTSTPGTLAVSNVSITNNMCMNSGKERYSDTRYPAGVFSSGIAIYASFGDAISDVRVSGNRVYDTQSEPTQDYGVYLYNTSNSYVLNNDLRAAIAPVLAVGGNQDAIVQRTKRGDR